MTAFLLKFFIVAVALEIVLKLRTPLTFKAVLIISIVVAAISYCIGDLIILPLSNNIVATFADVVITMLSIFMFNYLFQHGIISFYDALIASLAIGIGEIFFHRYMAREILPNHNR